MNRTGCIGRGQKLGVKGSQDLTNDVPANRPVKVLYIAGWGRSGSTILGRVLGQVEDFFLVGELRYIWDRGFIENRLCSCGVAFEACPVWREVVARAFRGERRTDAEDLVAQRERGLRTRHVLTAPTSRLLQLRVNQMQEYAEALGCLYRAVQSVSQSRVIVDTSKFPAYGCILRSIPHVELYVLHLVRDPRAVAHSWESKRKLKLDGSGPNSFMTPHGLVESSLVWDEWNLALENMRRYEPERYMLLRYEDFVENPRGVVKSVMRFLGEKESELPFAGERSVLLEAPHTFSGNPDRFRSGTMTIESDETWKLDMSFSRQAMVTSLTWPGMLRYGYPLRPQRRLVGSP